ncbi:MAG TPA: universal stress protein [Vicinamibacterales bacterium]|nr:universal stress protein [Vicinamibacterales bacterium]
MTAFKRILCPVDFSEFSRQALDEAIAIAHLYDGCVTALHVFPIAIPADPFGGLPEFQPFTLTDRHRAHILRQLSDFAVSEGAEARRITVALREGTDIHAEILEAADRMNPDLIVMGTHGRSGFQHVMLGSVAEKVLHKARYPVLTVPRRAPDAVPRGPVPFARILCGIDFSECSLAALRHAISLAADAGARVDVLSVVQLIPVYETMSGVPLYYPGLLGDLKADIWKRLNSVVAEAAPEMPVERIVTVGSPHREIVRVATERNAELVVLGAYSHGPIDHMFFGSTTNRVVHQARCPVLTVRT